MSYSYFEEVCEIMDIIADDYENTEKALEKLSKFDKAPKSSEEIETFVQTICESLLLREFNFDRIFPGIEYETLVEKLAPPLKKIFEKTPNKIILIGDVEEGVVGIHPFLTYFYKNLSRDGFSFIGDHYLKKLNVNVNCESISLGFNYVEIYLPLSLLEEPWVFYITLNEKDALKLPSLKFERNRATVNYKIKEHLDGSISFEIFKSEEKREKLSFVMCLPELFSEIDENARELKMLVLSEFEPYGKAILLREKLIEKLKEAHLEDEDFYNKLTKAKEADPYVPPDIPLSKANLKEYKVLYELALIELEDYIKERKEEIERKKNKIMERLMKG